MPKRGFLWLYNRTNKFKGLKDLLNPISQHYSKQGLWSLFLMCAFPLHAWTLILAFRDLSWLTDRTNAWDAVGVTAYGLLFAFTESVAIFLIAALMGFLVTRYWDSNRRISLLSVLVLILSLWAMVSQLYFLAGVSVPDGLIDFFAHISHPVRILYGIALAAVTPTVLVPALLILRSDKALQFTKGLIERLSLLTMFYLLFDVEGLVIVIIRNLS